MLIMSSGTLGDEQTLSDIVSSGVSIIPGLEGGGAVRPDVEDAIDNSTYEYFIAPEPGRDIRAIEFSGTGLTALDGQALRQFNASGEEQFSDAFPVLCTNVRVPAPKRNRPDATDTLSDCTTFLSLPDGTIRFFGATNGKSLVVVKYDPESANCTPADWNAAEDDLQDRICDGQVSVDGAPPQVSEAVADLADAAASRFGNAYVAISERKNVIAFPLDEDLAEVSADIETFATFNGKTLTGITPYQNGQFVVAADDGMLYRIYKDGGSWTSMEWKQLGLCLPDGRKTEQNISLQSDGAEQLLYVANQACGEVTVFANEGGTLTETFNTPLPLDNDPDAASPWNGADFFPSDIDVQIGSIGDLDDCTAAAVSEACQIGEREDEARVYEIEVFGDESTFRGFKFIFEDCRWSEGLPSGQRCPVTNCGNWTDDVCTSPRKEEQVLDIMALALLADNSGEFRRTLADPDNPPEVTLPGYLRAEDYIPIYDGLPEPVLVEPDPPPTGLVWNDWTFYWYFLATDAVIYETFNTQYNLDRIRGIGYDLCDKLPFGSSIVAVNQRSNVIAYTPDYYDTIDREWDNTDKKSATVLNSDCNRSRATSYQWSGQVVGIEFTEEEPDTFLEFTALQFDELQQVKDELLCNADLVLPDGPAGRSILDSPDDVGDCSAIQTGLNDISDKLSVCHLAALDTQGNSAENCNALFTKITNLRNILDTQISWPQIGSADAALLRILRPNYEGEFRARLDAFEYALSDWWLPSNAAPLVKITSIDADSITATAGDLEDGDLTGEIIWLVNGVQSVTTGGSLSLEPLGLVTGDTITATVTDSDGLQGSASVEIP